MFYLVFEQHHVLVALLQMVILFLDLVGLADQRILSQFAFAFQLDDLLHVFGQFLALPTPTDGVALGLLADLSVCLVFFAHLLELLLT